MGEEEGEDYSKFDPHMYWAWENNEHPAEQPGIIEWQQAEKLIHYCWKPRTREEIEFALPGVKHGLFHRLLYLIQNTRGLLITRRKDVTDPTTYQVKDSRVLKPKID